jgi:hypothetical protein
MFLRFLPVVIGFVGFSVGPNSPHLPCRQVLPLKQKQGLRVTNSIDTPGKPCYTKIQQTQYEERFMLHSPTAAVQKNKH